MLSLDSISLALVMVLALPLKNAVLIYFNSQFPVFELDVSFLNITSSVSMNLYPFIIFNRSFRYDSTNTLVFVKWFNGFKYLEFLSHTTSHAP